jgi:hypothetical protein
MTAEVDGDLPESPVSVLVDRGNSPSLSLGRSIAMNANVREAPPNPVLHWLRPTGSRGPNHQAGAKRHRNPDHNGLFSWRHIVKNCARGAANVSVTDFSK